MLKLHQIHVSRTRIPWEKSTGAKIILYTRWSSSPSPRRLVVAVRLRLGVAAAESSWRRRSTSAGDSGSLSPSAVWLTLLASDRIAALLVLAPVVHSTGYKLRFSDM